MVNDSQEMPTDFISAIPSVNMEENKMSLTKEMFKAVISTEALFSLKLFGFQETAREHSIRDLVTAHQNGRRCAHSSFVALACIRVDIKILKCLLGLWRRTGNVPTWQLL